MIQFSAKRKPMKRTCTERSFGERATVTIQAICPNPSRVVLLNQYREVEFYLKQRLDGLRLPFSPMMPPWRSATSCAVSAKAIITEFSGTECYEGRSFRQEIQLVLEGVVVLVL